MVCHNDYNEAYRVRAQQYQAVSPRSAFILYAFLCSVVVFFPSQVLAESISAVGKSEQSLCCCPWFELERKWRRMLLPS